MDDCGFIVSTHITEEFVEYWRRDTVVLYTSAVVTIFVFMGLVIVVYDFLVQCQQETAMNTAEKSTAIVFSHFFPKLSEIA